MSRLTAVKASNPQQGHLHATLDQMTGEKAGEMAELMWNLICGLLTSPTSPLGSTKFRQIISDCGHCLSSSPESSRRRGFFAAVAASLSAVRLTKRAADEKPCVRRAGADGAAGDTAARGAMTEISLQEELARI
ncbi:hypothetical protein [Mesorhizobium onobrychidis]|uniref:DUF982 domain-containing protein n=1 Tax=Mesorhizobium onobrychidis TaxID=2775404 RepID=A0ABY5QWF5_9HYPH|nr:hypothetical protein [Mesorhizobium onobrychidis]UVC15541.1 hypothetical protein IHQ72_34875 [Mesorhizobium onobrychidis]